MALLPTEEDVAFYEEHGWYISKKVLNKCKRLCFTGRIVSFEQYIDEFIAIYEETMN